jgi:hypothetical protein
MVIISDKKLSLFAKLLVSYVLLLDFAFLIFAFTAEPTTDVASVTASLLGWTATLFTPIAAYIFYDSWKDQNQHNKLQEIIVDTYTAITVLRKNIIRLKMNNKFIRIEDYLHLNDDDFLKTITKLREEYTDKINILRHEYDRTQNQLSLLSFYSDEDIKLNFESISNHHYKLIERLEVAYKEYTEFYINFKKSNHSYLENYNYKVCICQISLIKNSGLKAGNGIDELLGSFEDLNNYKNKTIEALESLKKLK